MNASTFISFLIIALLWYLSSAAKVARQKAKNDAPQRDGSTRHDMQMRGRPPARPAPPRQPASPSQPAPKPRPDSNKTIMEQEGYTLGSGRSTISGASIMEREGYTLGSGGATIRDVSLMEREGYTLGSGSATIRGTSLMEHEGYALGEGRSTIGGHSNIEREGFIVGGGLMEGFDAWDPLAFRQEKTGHGGELAQRPAIQALEHLVPMDGNALLRGVIFSEVLSRRAARKYSR